MDLTFNRLRSDLDASVNFVADTPAGPVEARYVRRCQDYFVIYVSSATGCGQACRMCFLTQSGQTRADDVDLDGFLAQTEIVLDHYDSQPPARAAHVSFMSRGEAFMNPTVLGRGDDLLGQMAALVAARGVVPRMKISTILPRSTMADRELIEVFPLSQPDIYLSLYSVDPAFRRRWLPKALPAHEALAKLARWQELTRKIPVVHWALIEGENDQPHQIEAICEAIRDSGLRPDVNLVRYNPFAPRFGAEPAEEVIAACAQRLRAGLPGARVKVVTRVGFDVKASCGMFVPGPDVRRRSA